MNNVQQDWWMSTIPNSGGGTIDANTPIAGLPSNLDTIAEQVTALQTALSQAAGAMQRNVYDANSDGNVDTVEVRRFNFASPLLVWTITHNLNRKPDVRLFLPTGQRFYATIEYPNNNTAQVTFGSPQAGYAEIQ